MQKSFLQLACGVVLPTGALVIMALSGCGGGHAGPVANSLQTQAAQRVAVRNTPGSTVTTRPTPKLRPTPTPVRTPTPRPTATPKPRATPTPSGPPALSPPAVVFDLRGRVLIGGVAQDGVAVQVKGISGAVTASDRAVAGAGGFYSFFLGGGTYVVTASAGKRASTRRVTIPPGGQTVDNFDLNL